MDTLGLDAFFKDATDSEVPLRGRRPDWEDIRSYYADRATGCVVDLLCGRPSVVPVYSYLADKRTGSRLLGPYETPIVVEGTFAFDVADLVVARMPTVKCVKILLTTSVMVAAVSRVIRDRAEQRQSLLSACRDSLSLVSRDRRPSRRRVDEADVVVTRRQIDSLLQQLHQTAGM
jgi:uridine kinase